MTPSSFDSSTDHIFGDLDKPKNAIKWLVKRYRGVHHYAQKKPTHPRPGESVRLSVTCSIDQPVESVFLWMSTDDWTNQTVRQFSYLKTTWKTEHWSYLQEWEITIPPQSAGTMLRYKIGTKLQGSDRLVFADSQSESFEGATHFSIWFSDAHIPKWVDDAIVYQIFMDRFNPGGGRYWQENADLRQRFGGTLQGVIEKLPYLQSMGFNAIWLTPVFASPSHHGYDISDYYHINPDIGSMDDFLTLLDAAHQQHIRVILDFVANHCSHEHPFFRAALADPNSQYHDFFVWKDWPEYECFDDVRSMPKLNLAYGSPARAYLLECAQYWLILGVDGFRLDYAHGPEQDFWVDFRRACESVGSDHWTFGEIVQPSDVQANYAGGIMGTLDFVLNQAIRLTFAQKEWKLSKFAAFVQNHFDYFPDDFSLPSFIDNHDMNRFMVAAKEDPRLLKLALLMLYTLPGPPIVYYGTEVPLSQNQSIHAPNARGFDEARLPMPWDSLDDFKLAEYLRRLANIRQKYRSAWQTGWKVTQFNDSKDMLVLEISDSQNMLLIINRSEVDRTFKIPITLHCCFQDLITDQIFESDHGTVNISLHPLSGMLLASI